MGASTPGGTRTQPYQPENVLAQASNIGTNSSSVVARHAADLRGSLTSGRTTAGTTAPVATATSESTAAPAVGVQWKSACEGQLAWLEEDIAVLSRRVKKDCAEIAGPPAEIAELMARLDADSAAERQSRMQLDAQLKALEDAVSQQHEEREKDLQMTSNDVESAMQGLIGRIDEGLSAGASSMRQRTEQTEQTLRTLIKRVDEGLCAGANALQSTLGSKLAFPSHNSTSASLEGSLRSPRSPDRIEKAPLEQGSLQAQSASGKFTFQPKPSPTPTKASTHPVSPGGTLQAQAARPASRPHWMSPGRRSPAHSPMGTPSACPSSLQVPGTGLSSLPSRACSPMGACAPMGQSMTVPAHLPVSPGMGSQATTPSWHFRR